jgi:hypothetical protein
MKSIMKKTDSLPSFFISSIPKSGTHLLRQIIFGIPHTTHKTNLVLYQGTIDQQKDHFKKLSQLKPNEFIVGHIYYSDRWAKMLQSLGMKHVFISRDLRDVIVSLHYYILAHLPNHPLYEYFKKASTTRKDCYMALIKGMKEYNYPNSKEYFNWFKGWMDDPETLTVTYEELMVSRSSRRKAITRIANYLWEDLSPPVPIPNMVNLMEKSVNPGRSPTFRKGQIGNWREEFDEELIRTFKQVAGGELIRLGYEKDDKW